MGHVVKFEVEIGDQQWHECKDKLPKGVYQEMETRRELAIMNEVMHNDGRNLLEKIDNTIDSWKNEKVEYNNNRYKLKHRILWQNLSKC